MSVFAKKFRVAEQLAKDGFTQGSGGHAAVVPLRSHTEVFWKRLGLSRR